MFFEWWEEGGISVSFAILKGKKRTLIYYRWEEKPPLNYFLVSFLREQGGSAQAAVAGEMRYRAEIGKKKPNQFLGEEPLK